MSFLRNSTLWFDGKMIPSEDANVSIVTHSLHYGSSIFEGVRAYETPNGPAIFRLQEHTDRFFLSAKLIHMPLPFSKEALHDAQKMVIRENNLRSAYIRPLAFYGSDALGVFPGNNKVHVAIAAWQWENYFKVSEDSGMSVTTSTFQRQSISSVLGKAKVGGYYVNSMLALNEARRRGYQEAILFDKNGFIAEGSSANIFLVKKGILYTPTDKHILPGITRASIIELAQQKGLRVIEKDMSRDELYAAEEVFLSGTAAEVLPISKIDDEPVGNGKVGEITQILRTSFFDVIAGKNPQYQHWNALV